MDDFEKEYPGFDWKNTPAYKHPGGKNCPCPKHEYIREQINFTKQVNQKGKEPTKVTLRFCPDHYKVYMEEVIPAMPLKYRTTYQNCIKVRCNSSGKINTYAIRYLFLLQIWFWWTRQEKRASTNRIKFSDRTDQNFRFVWSIMVTAFSTKWAFLSVQKNALADMRIKV